MWLVLPPFAFSPHRCLGHCIIFLLGIPSAYVFLMIFSVANCHSVSWGTRETATYVLCKCSDVFPSLSGEDFLQESSRYATDFCLGQYDAAC